MRIVFIGTVEFSLKSLEKLIFLDANIVGVCTKELSKINSDFADLVPLCQENQIPYRLVTDINSRENLEWIGNLNPDIIFCFGWSSLIKKELLELAPMGIVGYHPAKLPENRGRHPLIWALFLGMKQSASTFFFMDEGADSGDILSQVDFEINIRER
jgi:methionyl-tRNA formyltransferase